jgi:uncharacterized protein
MTQLQERLHKIADCYRLDLVYSFGSRTRQVKDFLGGLGELDKSLSSDVDIAVKLTPDQAAMSVREKVKLAIDLEDLFGLGPVDLVILSEADPFLAASIVRGERIFCRDPYLADEHELYVLRRAGDLAPFELERLSMIFTKAS